MPEGKNNIFVDLKDYKTAFCCFKKVANSSIRRALSTALGYKNSSTKVDIGLEYIDSVPSHYTTIVFCRNPYDRCASGYRFLLQNKTRLHAAFRNHPEVKVGMSFDSYVEAISSIPDERADQHFRGLLYGLHCADVREPTFVYKFERMMDGWSEIRALMLSKGLDIGRLGHEKKMDAPMPRLSESTKKRIYARYEQDFSFFGYRQ